MREGGDAFGAVGSDAFGDAFSNAFSDAFGDAFSDAFSDEDFVGNSQWQQSIHTKKLR